MKAARVSSRATGLEQQVLFSEGQSVFPAGLRGTCSPLRLTYQTSGVTFPLRPSPCHTVLELNTTVWALREGRCNGEVWAWFLTTVRRKNRLEAKSQLPSIQADVCADGPACTILWQRSPSYIMLLHFLQQAMQPHTRITFALWDSV